MECKVVDKREVRVVISRGELMELVAKKTGKLPPQSCSFYLDGYGTGRIFYGGKSPTEDLSISWTEEIK